MNYIWSGLIIISIITGAINGRLDEVMNAMLNSVQSAVSVAIALVGIMAFWLGIVKIADKAGLVNKFAKLISPILRKIFNELPKDSPAFSNIALNFSANALGLANAATPFGIKAMQDLKKEGEKEETAHKNTNFEPEKTPETTAKKAPVAVPKDTATNSMCIFLGMNTAGFQLIPASVIAILVAAGSPESSFNPTEIIVPTLIVTTIAFISAICISKILAPFFKIKNSENTGGGAE